MSYITHTRNGSYCDACGSVLSQEEIDFECCDCCGGEGFGDDDDDQEELTDEQLNELVDFIRASKANAYPQGGKP